MKAFTRISDVPITTKSQVYLPDYVVVLDHSLMKLPEILEGVKPESVVIVNTETPCTTGNKTYTYNATSLALDILGRDTVNTAMLGIFAKVSGLVSLESLMKAMEEFPPKLAETNKKLVEEVFNRMEVKE